MLRVAAGSLTTNPSSASVMRIWHPSREVWVRPKARSSRIHVTSVAAGYALGRLRPPGFRWWRRVIFAVYVIPQTLLFIPLYRVVHTLGLDDNLVVLLLIYPTMALPFCVWMFSAYFQLLPREIEEAALIEGANRATAFFRIILPMTSPGITVSFDASTTCALAE